MSFASPVALLLLLTLPLVWYVGFPRYRYRRRRDVASLLIRTLLLLCLIAALAGLQVVRAIDRLAVVFLVDASDSIGVTARQAQRDYIQAAVAAKAPDDEWAVVVFGENVSIDKPFSAVTEFSPVLSTVLPGNTNIAEAIQTGISLFPANAVRRLVLLSDGDETLGSALAKAQLAAASGVEISVVPLSREAVADVRITALDAPPRVTEGQEFDISVSISAEVTTDATLLIFSSGNIIEEATVNLRPGTTSYTLTQTATESGFLNFSAQLILPGDGINQNNTLAAFSQVVGAPRVLLISHDDAEITQLLPALQSAGILVDVRTPGSLPPDTAALAAYKSILIANVPATEFSNAQMTRLQSYVRDLGGGLVFIGGPDSYGPGRYYQTPIEETLPIDVQIRDQQRIPQLTIAYLIDRSGSMSVTDRSGVPNIELAKRAISLSIDFLQPTDRAGIGSFDTGGSWVVPLQDIDDKRTMQDLIGTLRPGGGTDIMAGMRLVEQDMVNEPSQRKHIILLTDGGANPLGLIELTQRLHDEFGITTSVIAIGTAPPAFLRRMTEVGGGNFHAVADISQIPNIFAMEMVLATRSYIEEGSFTPRLTANSPIMEGITALPALDGYVATTPKFTAQTILRGDDPFADPILVQWQYGLGRAIAFTSDATSRWATQWTAWENFPRFWAQVINWSIVETAQSNLETQVIMRDNRAIITVDARDEAGAFLNNLSLEASILNPNNEPRTVPLQQVAPGRYEARFMPDAEGAYFLAINGQGSINGELVTFNEVNGWVQGYSAEYVQSAPDETLLENIAALTGGQTIGTDPAAAFALTTELRTAAAPVAPWLLLFAALLLPLDIAIRRLIITQSDLARLRAYLFGENPTDTEQTARISALKEARGRARERLDAVPNITPEAPAAPTDTAPMPPRRPSPAEAPPTIKAGEGSTVNNLLKRRRRDSENEE